MNSFLGSRCRAALRAVAFFAALSLCPDALYAATPRSGCGTIATDTVWTADHLYVLDGCDLTIEAGATLTIQPGAVVKLWVDSRVAVQGILSAEGTSGEPIVFTSLADDAHGGDTNGDGTSAGSRGDWGAITVEEGGSARVHHAEIAYGGGYYYFWDTKANLRCLEGEAVLEDVTLRDSAVQALYAEHCKLSLTNSTVGANGTLGLSLVGLPADTPVRIEGNTFATPPGSLIAFDGNPHWPVTIRNNRSPNGAPGLTLSGTLNGDLDWDNDELVLVTPSSAGGGLTVGPEATLRLAPGSIVKSPFDTHDSLTVQGVMFADGTRAKPIVFTSLTDDAHGGDTNNDGPSTGSRGDWSAVTVGEGGYAHVSHAEILYGGWYYYWWGDNAGLRCDGGDAVLEDVTLRDNLTHAILARNGPVRIRDSRIADNDHGVLNLVGGRVDARRNWWGDATGPHNDTANPDGTGAAIDDGVGFEPWLGTFNWLDVDDALFHGTETLAWATFGRDPAGLTVDIRIAGGSTDTSIATGLPATGTFPWQSDAVPDGSYELHATLRDVGSAVIAEARRTVLVNNSAGIVWHAGPIRTTETWAANKVHVVEREVQITTGGAVTIPAGTVVKAAPETRILVLNGGSLTIASTPAAPAILTSFADDEAGGDTNLDGAATQPLPGDWTGVSALGTGALSVAGDAEIRYTVAFHAGTAAAGETWDAERLHVVLSDVTVPDGVTLTIAAGAQVKFAAKTGITVQSGGTLVATGTADDPIDLTSERDDAVAGDTNRDGSATTPAAGDWQGLRFEGGEGTIDHARIHYAGGTDSGEWEAAAGAISALRGAVVGVSNSEILQPLFEAVKAWQGGYGEGGNVTVTSCVLAGADRGVNADGNSVVRLLNTTVDDCRVGIWGHGGQIDIVNSIVSNSGETGIDNVLESPLTIRYSDVWSAQGANYGTATGDPTGTNGNISADPKYVDAGRGDYRLGYLSPAIDAADGSAAPATDLRGIARYDDPRSPNTGTAAGNGAYADMGAYEFADNAPSALDLVVTSVSGPTAALAGDTVTVRWTVRNTGSQTVTGPWHDTVNLVLSPDANPTVVLAGEAAVAEDVRLGPGQSYTMSAEIRVPGSVAGAHYWQVVTNARDEVFEGRNHANNARLSDVPVMLDLPELVVDGSSLSRQFDAQGQEHWFKFEPEAGEDILVRLDRAGSGGATELYIAQGYMPTRSRFDIRQNETHAADATAVAAGTSTQTYYVLAYPASLPDGAGAFSIEASTLQFGVESVTPTEVGNGGLVTLAVHGGKLGEGITFEIVDAHGGIHAATSVFIVDSSLAYVTFDLTGLPLGAYDVRARQGASVITLDNGVNVVAGEPGSVEAQLGMPSALRPDWTGTVTVDYANTGDTDVVAPLMVLNVSNARLRLPGKTEFAYSTVQLLGINSEGPAGVLPPGARGTIELEMKPTGGGDIDAKLWVLSDPARAWDWSQTKSFLRPSFVPEDAWDAIFANFTADMGSTVGEIQRKLAGDATYLSRLGDYTHDVQRLLAFALNQAGLREITRRYALGAFGRGAQAWWEIKADEDEAGNVTIGAGSSLRFFRHRSDGSYRGVAGDRAVLTKTNDEYRLREPNGQVTVFDQTGKLQFLEDRNGNRMTATYSGGHLTGLALSNGDTITYRYDGNGRVVAATDTVGRTITYTYDPAGEHVVSIEGTRGTATLTYLQGQGAAREHAVESVAFPDGAHLFYDYDDRGRLAGTHTDGGAEAVRYEYGPHGETTVVNATGESRQVLFNDTGQLARIESSGSNLLSFSYDERHMPVGVEGPDAWTGRLEYDSAGNLTTVVDPLGGQIHLAHEPTFGKVTALTNSNGATTTFARDQNGNLTGVTFPDGGSQSFVYDAVGNPTAWTNGRGGVVHYVYDAKNLLVREELPDGSHRDFTYDAHRNLVTAADASGTTRLEYDGADRLTKLTYPSGRFLRFSYDPGGRRVRTEDQDGFAVQYAYDSVGRLSALKDGSGETIVAYGYDAVGRLARKDLGNGAYTTYDYDEAGRIAHLVNFGDDGTVLSRFDYGYDDSGRRTRMGTVDGEWTYAYDAAGQLTRAVFASTNPAIQNQDLSYSYDPAGNRVRTVLNGVTTAYEANESDQYTSIGASPYSYDADGNLVSRGNGAGAWTYSYDAEDRLVSASGPGGTWTYEYDVFGYRVAGVHGGERTEYLVDPLGMGDVVGAYDGTGTLSARYVHGLGLVARVDAGGHFAYFNSAALGNVSEVVDDDGTVLNQYAYLPFGGSLRATESVPNPFQHVGAHGVMRDGTGLDFMRARPFDTGTGRFIQRDPIGMAGGVNTYAYVGNSPANGIDPSGLVTMTDYGLIRAVFVKYFPADAGYVDFVSNVLIRDIVEKVLQYKWGSSLEYLRQFVGKDLSEAMLEAVLEGPEAAAAVAAEEAAVAAAAEEAAAVAAAEEAAAASAVGLGTVVSGVAVAVAVGVVSYKVVGPAVRYIPGVDSGAQWGWNKLDDWTSGWLFGIPPVAEQGTPVVSSHDPNDLLGPAGSGSTHWVTADQTLLYTIRFENDKNATAPAQAVHITEQLDANLDFTTFELTSFGFGDVAVDVPAGRTFYSERLDLRDTYGLYVDITGELNMDTGEVTWDFVSIDPETGQPPRDPLAGFLPPNTTAPMGEGFVRYTIRAGGEAGVGVPVQAQASIVFDTNDPIPTNVHVNPIGPIADCAGDCNADGAVSINELIKGVNIALEVLPIESCVSFDSNADGEVTVNEIVAAVNNALNGCPLARPPATPAPTETSQPGPSIIVPATATRTPTWTPVVPSPTASRTPTRTKTPVSPTPTVSRTPTVSPTPTQTAVSPTPTQTVGFATPTPPGSGTPPPPTFTLAPGGHVYCDTLAGPLAIPDGDELGVADSIAMADDFSVGKLTVQLQINHTWVGDLTVELSHVATLSTASLLFLPGVTESSPLGCDNADIDCTFDDDASIFADDQCSLTVPAIGGTVAPTDPLSIFTGESSAGAWTLQISDLGAGDTGSLVHWCLRF